MSKFAKNFGRSSLAYLALSFIWYFASIHIARMTNYYGVNSLVDSNNTFSWVFWLVWWSVSAVQTALSATVLFFLGSKLDLLGKHRLNLLSVSGSLVYTVLLGITFWPFVLSAIFPFYMLSEVIWFVLLRGGVSELLSVLVAIFVPSILPSIVTWLGMMHKTRKNGREKESDVRHIECN